MMIIGGDVACAAVDGFMHGFALRQRPLWGNRHRHGQGSGTRLAPSHRRRRRAAPLKSAVGVRFRKAPAAETAPAAPKPPAEPARRRGCYPVDWTLYRYRIDRCF